MTEGLWRIVPVIKPLPDNLYFKNGKRKKAVEKAWTDSVEEARLRVERCGVRLDGYHTRQEADYQRRRVQLATGAPCEVEEYFNKRVNVT